MNEIIAKIEKSMDFIKARTVGDLKLIIDSSHPEGIERYRQAVIEMDAKYSSAMNDWLNWKEFEVQKEELKQTIPTPKTNLEIRRIELKMSQLETSIKTALREVLNFIQIIKNDYQN